MSAARGRSAAEAPAPDALPGGSANIVTERFVMRALTAADATQRYLGWLHDQAASKYIVTAAQTRALEELQGYVREREGRDDVLFLGIFDRSSGVHIGNIKYEPVDRDLGYAVMGMLIGDAAYRGHGVAAEVLKASGAWLRRHRGVRQIVLGVETENVAAIRAYEKVGFVVAQTPYIDPSPGAVTMVWRLDA